MNVRLKNIVIFFRLLVHPRSWLPSVFWWAGIAVVIDALLSYWCWKDCICYHPYGEEWLLTAYLLRAITTNC